MPYLSIVMPLCVIIEPGGRFQMFAQGSDFELSEKLRERVNDIYQIYIWTSGRLLRWAGGCGGRGEMRMLYHPALPDAWTEYMVHAIRPADPPNISTKRADGRRRKPGATARTPDNIFCSKIRLAGQTDCMCQVSGIR